ncbi:hypothetical protein CORC01_01225 [Colletotrichum orchidophilum]|uniref:Uncharacterized protein n=1 Tax=Colletotrichum orchidophilum TaxID=1209926 RepID=A0A1G4BQE7_9PEZI|nr:uncharacterized protein CORC01_01225 [Colletotrichum orchidophilum]OHF03506.1 hypothetical protein CORC01_01225 [Colletotrichum orchidophilum]
MLRYREPKVYSGGRHSFNLTDKLDIEHSDKERGGLATHVCLHYYYTHTHTTTRHPTASLYEANSVLLNLCNTPLYQVVPKQSLECWVDSTSVVACRAHGTDGNVYAPAAALCARRPDSSFPECPPEDRRHATSLTSPDVLDLVLQHTLLPLPCRHPALHTLPSTNSNRHATVKRLSLTVSPKLPKTLNTSTAFTSHSTPITNQSRSSFTAPLSSRLPSP